MSSRIFPRRPRLTSGPTSVSGSRGSPTRSRCARRTTPSRKRSCTSWTQKARSTEPPRLPRVGERAPDRAVDRAAEVRVGAHDHRVLAAELEDAALHAARAGLADLAAGGERAREAHLRDRRVDEGAAGLRMAVQDAQQTLRQACAGEHARDPVAGQRRVGRWLEDDAVAGHERHRDVAQGRREGLGGRAEHGHDAERLVGPARAGERAQHPRQRGALAAEDPWALLGQPLQRLDRRQDLHELGLRARAPLLAPEEVDDLVRLVDDRLRGALHVPRPVLEPQHGPQPLHGGRAGDLALHGPRRGDGDRPEHLPGRRAQRLQRGRGLGRGVHGRGA